MHFSSILLAFAASSVLATNTLDVAEEGVFLVRTNDQGVEELETLISARDLDEMESGHTTRADQNLFCGCGFGLNPRHTDRVITDLRLQLARDAKPGAGGLLYTEIKPGQSYYSEMGLDTVAFVCNYSTEGNVRIQVSQYRDIIASITRACGGYIAGSAGIKGAVSVGYMRSRQNFCRNALTSSADHC
ncbi:hypothetical protein LIA77_00698 [Sarocladium implicatum]|nr:hypothetical protein LIA77_00698 [Sarocladium implicatum]